MSKTPLPASTYDVEDLLNHPAIAWVIQNKQNILYGIAAFFAILILGYRIVSSRTLDAEKDYIQVENEFARFQENSLSADKPKALESFDKIESIIHRYSSLQAKYDGLTAQTLLIDQEVAKAYPFAERTFIRVKDDHIAFFEDFAKNSLIISEGKYDQALSQAEELKKKMDQANVLSTQGRLYVFNLLRLAVLYQQLNRPADELKAWETLKAYEGNREAVLAIHDLYREGNSSLSNYVEERMKKLER